MTSLSSLNPDLARNSFSVSGRESTSSLLDRSSSSNSTPTATKDSSLYRSQSRWLKLQSWRGGVMLCALSALFATLVNMAFMIWASTRGFEGGIATIQEGDCSMTKKLDLWLHLGINLLSTLLLGASNYTMQCLSAPTRDEINKAHRQRNFLDIGIPSVRNLRRISGRRMTLWWLLAISSIPLHLMYNSAVFSTLSDHEYSVAIVSHDFLTGAPFSDPDPLPAGVNDTEIGYSSYPRQRFEELQNKISKLQNLSNDACVKAYRNEIVPDRRSVLAVSSATEHNNSLLKYFSSDGFAVGGEGVSSYQWTCPESGDDCVFSAQNWTVLGFPIEYCLSDQIESSCKLQLSLVIMVIVVLCNFAKALCMSLTIWKLSSMPLLTLGDVIASFLDRPDPHTANNCLASKYRFRGPKYACSKILPSSISIFSGHGLDSNAANNRLIDKNQHRQAGWDEEIKTFKPESYRWYHTASLKRWLLCISLCTLTLIIAGLLLGEGLGNSALSDRSMSHLWSLGYGGISSETTVRFEHFKLGRLISGKLIPMILVANLPQALLSFLYLTYNALFTTMILAEEWSGFAHERKTLRVSFPVGNQRSTYWLQLPYFYSIPLLVMSGILHWLVSQSLFLVRIIVERRGYEEQELDDLISTCGYSPIAIITIIPLGALLLLVVIAIGFREYRKGMPLAGSCSAAISAACHRPEEDLDAAVLPVLWGVVSTEGPIGHCCFTSFEVSRPVEGESYADRDAISSKDSGAATGAEYGQIGSGSRSRT